MSRIKALIFDVDGTLAETEEVHRQAFNRTFEEFDLDWHWDQATYKQLLKVTGGRERMEHHALSQGLPVPDCAALHKVKTAHYNSLISQSGVTLRPGVEALLVAAREAGMVLAIATTTSRPNVTSLISSTLGGQALGWFTAICCGEDVRVKKPNSEVYRLALELCAVEASQALAFEDSANGLRAAKAAGMACIVTPGIYTLDDDFSGADLMVENLAALEARLPFLLSVFG